MAEKCTYINKPVDLGCYKMVLKDHFQVFIKGWVEPFENKNDPRVPFNFGEDTDDERYKVSVVLTMHEFSNPVVVYSSEDEKGLNGYPSVILKSGTDPDEDPSVIAVDAPFLEKDEMKFVKNFLLGITITNPEGAVITMAHAKITNDWRNYL